MANLVITNSFTSGTTILSAQVNTNFSDVSTYINNRNSNTTAWDYVKSTNAVTILLTTNQLVLGTTNTTTLSATAPSASRTYTIPDAGADSSFLLNNTQLVGKGTTTNDSASSGYVGEYIESSVSTAANAASSTTYGNITSVSLTAGDWDVSGQVQFNLNGSTVNADCLGAISVNSGNTTTDHVNGKNVMTTREPGSASNTSVGISYRLSLSSTTTVYLKARLGYSAGTPQTLGTIFARRRR